MDFKKLEHKVVQNAKKYGERNNLKIDHNFAVIKLYEEVGEFSQAVLIHQKKSRPSKFVDEQTSKNEIAKELADIVGMVMVNANLFEIDLEKAIFEKWIDKKT